MKLPNIVVRALSGVVFIGLLIGGMLINEYTFVIVFAVVTALCLWEFYGLIINDAKIQVSRIFNIIGGLLLFAGSYCYSGRGYLFSPDIFFCMLPYTIFLLVLFISELYLKRPNPIQSLAYSLLGQVYIALPFSLAFSLAYPFYFSAYIPTFILAVFVLIWVNDTFAYLSGMTFGKHRLFERISPKKSWEGFIGGAVAAVIVALLFNHFAYTFLSAPQWIGFALIVVAFGTWGDLFESLIKRTIGVKDSGNMIPGHGGILDRFDSSIFAIPAVAIYMVIIRVFFL